jgi:hypothetical protein
MAMFETKWPDIDPSYHIEQFKLYYWGTTTRNKDWGLTFQRWMNQEQARAKTQPWRGGGNNSETAQKRREAERKATEDYLAEIEAQALKSAPAPQCEHGKNLLLCRKCLK